jgi:CheY-like chemotaxis protein
MNPDRPHILLIDDDQDLQHAITMILGPDRYDITCCTTGAGGLEAMRHRRPDLVLLDIMLASPREGLQVACQMRQDANLRDIPIIFMSAINEQIGSEYAKEVCPIALQADMFLEKPLDAATLREAVTWVLEQRARGGTP